MLGFIFVFDVVCFLLRFCMKVAYKPGTTFIKDFLPQGLNMAFLYTILVFVNRYVVSERVFPTLFCKKTSTHFPHQTSKLSSPSFPLHTAVHAHVDPQQPSRRKSS